MQNKFVPPIIVSETAERHKKQNHQNRLNFQREDLIMEDTDTKNAKRSVRAQIDTMLDGADLGETYACYIAVQGALSRHRTVKKGGRRA